MRALRAAFLRAIDPLRRRRRERQLEEELEAHLQLHIDDGMRAGLSADEARRQALLRLGGLDLTRERYRARRGFRILDALRQDTRQAFRTVRHNPGFSAVAVLTLGIGIGSVAVMYSVIRQVLLDPFPYIHSDRMVDVLVRDQSTSELVRGPLPAAEFLDYQEQSAALEDVLGTIVENVHYTSEDGADRLDIAWVTPNMFSFLGAKPLIGRAFDAADARPDAPPIAVMNHRTWVAKFGADPAVIGRTLILDGEPRTVVGVMPPRFEWNVGDLWAPSELSRSDSQSDRQRRWFQARLRPGVTVEQAQAELDVIAHRRAERFPTEYPKSFKIDVVTVIDWVVGRFRRVLYTLFAAVGLLLLIACCNVSNMLLARATTRAREMSVRAALGASRGRLVRQLLAESLLLACGGAAAGSLLALGGIRVLATWMPRQNIPWETTLRLDAPVLLFALVTAVAATLAFGIFPALQSARRDLAAGAGGSGRSGTATRSQTRARGALVVAEVSLSVVLLLGAGIVMRSFIRLVETDLRVDTSRLLSARVSFAPGRRQTADERQRFYRDALERISRLPGITAATFVNGVAPFGGQRSDLAIDGEPASPNQRALVRYSTEGFRETVGMRLVAGRDLTAAEIDGARKVALVNETFVRRYFDKQNPLGRVIELARLKTLSTPVADPRFEIVGVVSDVINQDPRRPVEPEALISSMFRAAGPLTLNVRTEDEPGAIWNLLRAEVRAIDDQAALTNMNVLDQLLRTELYAQPRFVLIILGMFAATGLTLVALGIYGVLAYTVSQQTREIAIRVAMGGERRDVLRHVMGMGVRLVAIGVGVGIVASLGANRLLHSQLWNTSPYDLPTHVTVVAVILAVGVVACLIPARRAMRVDPIVALRHD